MRGRSLFWIGFSDGANPVPDRLIQAGYAIKDQVLRFAARLLRDDMNAPALTEEAISRVRERCSDAQLADRTRPEALVYRQVRRLIVREWRRQQRIQHLPDLEQNVSDPAGQFVERVHTQALLERLGSVLDEDLRMVFDLALLDLTPDEIARSLGISRNAVYKRQRRIVEIGRRVLGGPQRRDRK